MAEQIIGVARVDITADASSMEAAINTAKNSLSSMSNEAQAQYQKLSAAERRRIDSLVRQADTIGMTRAQQIAYSAALRTSGPILDEVTKKLISNGNAAKLSANEFNKYGLTAKMELAALRQVPAQITDIIVSLQGGQRPLTVLLQQGGQLKDVFGGVVPAAKALSSQLVGMITPLSVLAAGGVALFAAWYKGYTELDAARKQLAMTGDALGITENQVARLSLRLTELDGVTRGKAVSALTEIIKTGKITGSQLESVAEIAVRSNQILGREISETVDEFVRLAKEPTKASAELAKTYNHLTAETYLRIRALEEQGESEKAAALAQDELARVTNQRLTEVKDNLGILESAWNLVGRAAKWSWDNMLDIGRPDTLVEKIDQQIKVIQELKKRRDEAGGGRGVSEAIGVEHYVDPMLARRITEEEKALENLRHQLRAESGRRVLAANREYERQLAESRENYIADHLSRSEQRKKEVEEENRKWEKLSAGLEEGSKDYQRLYEAYKNSLKGIEEKYKEKSGGRPYRNDAATQLMQSLRQQEEVLKEQLTTSDKLGEKQKALVAFEQRIADIKAKDILTADEKSLLRDEESLRNQHQRLASLEEENRLKKRQEDIEKVLSDLRAQQSTTQIQFMRELASFGQGDRVRELNADLAKVEDRYRSLIESRRNSSQGLSDGDLAKIRGSLQSELDIVRWYHEKKLQYQQDWRLGAKDALKNYANEAADVFGSVSNLATQSFKGMEDALTTYVRTGKASFSDLANSIIDDMIRIMIQQSITGPLAMMFGGWLGGLGGASGSAVAGADLPGIGGSAGGLLDGIGFSSGGYTGSGGKHEPAGIVHKNEGVLNAEEIRAIGGEAGFNALRRAIRGRGHASGGMAGRPALPPMAASPRATGAVNVTVNVSGGGGAQVNAPAGWEDFAKEIGEFVDAKIRARETRSQMQGGLAWQARQGAFR
ncbi:phage tail tape measure protein [Kerstersia gyiorum]|nr:phage tail tape measure protein [Kerstersia gyiorum]